MALALPSAFYGSEKTIPNMLFVFLLANFFYSKAEFVGGALSLALAAKRREKVGRRGD